MIKVILLTLLVYWSIQTVEFFILGNILDKDAEEALVFLGGPVFLITISLCWLCRTKIYPWFSDNFCYSFLSNSSNGAFYYCKRKYFYALIKYAPYVPCSFERTEFCADKWKKDNVRYSSKYAPRYVKKICLPVNKEECKRALEQSNEDMNNFKKHIKESANYV